MKNVLQKWFLACSYSLLTLIFILSPLLTLKADIEHYKNILIGGRASTMGGAYTAISDDASGCYYNPAGIAFAQGDSFSGSAKVWSNTTTRYKNTIGNNDWVRESSNLLANFFGIVKRSGKHAFGISYAVPVSVVEHQDQIYTNITGVANPIDTYAYNLHSEDDVNLVGASYSYRIRENFSLGLTLYYYSRVYRKNFHYLLKFTGGTVGDESLYLNNTFTQKGIKPKVGMLWNVVDSLSIGLSVATTFLASKNLDVQSDSSSGSATHHFATLSTKPDYKMPHELSLGVAYFASPYFLISSDLDYFKNNDATEDSVINLSVGTELYVNNNNAIRFGAYTNNTKSKEISETTTAPNQHLDMYGITTGITFFNRESSITIGGVYSEGSGKAQPYSGSTTSRDLKRSNWTLMTSADYGF